MIIDLIVGCRPNFVKAAAIIHAAEKYPDVTINLIHTGQHAGDMSDPFFKELQLPEPRHSAPGFSTACAPVDRLSVMIRELAEYFRQDKPDYVMVVGDTDSTLAGALAAAKLGIPLIHVEAGLRSYNRNMQEEINRILVDAASDICYTTTYEARYVLLAAGHLPRDVVFVGNVMIDTLYRFWRKARLLHPYDTMDSPPYAVLTLHRAENVDRNDVICNLLCAADEISDEIDLVWPVHPRVGSQFNNFKGVESNIKFVPPAGYLAFIALISGASFVMTDSGGVQEETTALGVPCLTLRNETERPETVSDGSNTVIGTDPDDIVAAAFEIMQRKPMTYPKPALWDGHAADRILADLVERRAGRI